MPVNLDPAEKAGVIAVSSEAKPEFNASEHE